MNRHATATITEPRQAWTAGYGVIRHTPLTRRRVDRDGRRPGRARRGRPRAGGVGGPACRRSRRQRRHVAGRPRDLRAQRVPRRPARSRLATSRRSRRATPAAALNMVPAYAGYMAVNALSGLTRGLAHGPGSLRGRRSIPSTCCSTTCGRPHAERYDVSDAGLTRYVRDFYAYRLDAHGGQDSPLGSHVNAHTAGGHRRGRLSRLRRALVRAHAAAGRAAGGLPLRWRLRGAARQRLGAALVAGRGQRAGGADHDRQRPPHRPAHDDVAGGRRAAGSRGTCGSTASIPSCSTAAIPRPSRGRSGRSSGGWQAAARAVGEGRRRYPVPLPYGVAVAPKGAGFYGAGTNLAHNLPLGANPHTDAAAARRFNTLGPPAVGAARRAGGGAGDAAAPRTRRRAPARARHRARQPRAGRCPACPSRPGGRCQPTGRTGGRGRARPDGGRRRRLPGDRAGQPPPAPARRQPRRDALQPDAAHARGAEVPGDGARGRASPRRWTAPWSPRSTRRPWRAPRSPTRAGSTSSSPTRRSAPRCTAPCGRRSSSPIISAGPAGRQAGCRFPSCSPRTPGRTARTSSRTRTRRWPRRMLAEPSHVSRVLFPPTHNTAAAAVEAAYRTRGQIWTLVVPKGSSIPDLFTADEARALVRDGAAPLTWAGFRARAGPAHPHRRRRLPARPGASRASERLADAGIEHAVVAMLEPGRFRAPRDAGERGHAAPRRRRGALLPGRASPRASSCPTRGPRACSARSEPLHTGAATVGLGFTNQGGTLSIESMLFVNRASWAHALEAAARLLGLPRERAARRGRVRRTGWLRLAGGRHRSGAALSRTRLRAAAVAVAPVRTACEGG